MAEGMNPSLVSRLRIRPASIRARLFILVLAVAVPLVGVLAYSIYVDLQEEMQGIPTEVALAAVRAAAIRNGLLTLAIIVFAAALAFYFHRQIERPIRGLAQAAEAVAQGQLETRVPVNSPVEIAEVAKRFNAMVAARAQVEEALRESEQHFRWLAEKAPDMVYRYEFIPQRRFAYVSPASTVLNGYTPEEHYADPDFIFKLVHPEDRHLGEAAFWHRRLQDRPLTMRWVRKDGTVIWTEQLAVPLYNGTGDFVAMQGIVRDITERKLVEEAHATRAAENARLLALEQVARAQAEATTRRLQAIQTVTDVALAHLIPDDLHRELLGRIRRILATDTASILLLSEDERVLVVRASQGLEEEVRDKVQIPIGRGVAGQIAGRREPMIVEDLATVEVASPILQAKIRSLLGVPLMINGRAIGVIHVGTFQPRRFTEEDLQLLQLVADRAASAIERARLYEQMRIGSEQMHQLAQQVLMAQEVERRRLSRELHDEAGQALTALKISLGLVQEDLLANFNALQQRMNEAVTLTGATMEQIRVLAQYLRPPALDAVGLNATLEGLCQDFARRTHLAIDYTGVELPPLPDAINICLYRFLQEALTNVAKHAHANQVRVALGYDAGKVSLSVEDDGQGFDKQAWTSTSSQNRGIGLLGMEERLALLGGRLEIESRPGQGTHLVAEVPWKEAK